MIDHEAARIAMVDRQVRPSDVTSFPIIEAMLSVPRERFAPAALRAVCYAGGDLAQGGGRFALDPRVFAKLIDAADIGPDDLALDLGCGLGYSTAVLARLAAAVVAVESDESLARQAQATLTELEVDTATVEHGPLEAGAPASGPYDVIFLNGAVQALPEAVVAQLRIGGRMVGVDVSDGVGRASVWTRGEGGLTRRRAFDANAPLLDGFEKAAAFQF